MEAVVARATDPLLARVKLAWWREQLEALDNGSPPAEPRLRAVAEELLPRGVAGADVAALETGWATLLDDPVDFDLVQARGQALFGLSAALIGTNDPLLDTSGTLYGLMSSARTGLAVDDARIASLLAAAGAHRVRRPLRPVSALARLAARDARHGPPFEPEGSPGRALAVLAHLWSGRIR